MGSETFGRLSPPGVDLIELEKAKRFYDLHKNRLDSFLTEPEIAYLRNHRRPYVGLAVLFAAKEAAFKSLGGSRRRLAGFSDIPILPGKDGTLAFSSRSSLRKISFRISANYVVARCVGT